MRIDHIGDLTCSIARAIGSVGDPWTLIMIRELFLGSRRFEQFEAQLRASPALISARLKELESDGVIVRNAYQTNPPRYEYRLTEKGLDLWPLFVALKHWGEKWGGLDQPVAHIRHKSCGHVTALKLVCECCGEPLDARSVSLEQGPEMLEERAGFASARREREAAKVQLRRRSARS